MRDMRTQPAGWYRDTDRPNLHRYWTGEAWSDRLGEELARRARSTDQQPCGDRRDPFHDDRRACG